MDIKAIIIDDEPLARQALKAYLTGYPDIIVLAECNNGLEGLKEIQRYQPELIFLDIQMAKINGFEMLELIDNPPLVIFTTAFEEYAVKAFEHHAVDYLLKPFSKERFDIAIRKLKDPGESARSGQNTKALLESAAFSPQQRQRVVIKMNDRIKIIATQEIWYVEGADDYVKIHTAEGVFLKNRTMAHFEQMLDPGVFVRIHRSFIVNIQQVIRVEILEKDNRLAMLRSGARLPVSKTGYSRLKGVLKW